MWHKLGGGVSPKHQSVRQIQSRWRRRQDMDQILEMGNHKTDRQTRGSTAGLFAALADGDDTAIFDGSAEATRCLLLLLRVAQTVTDELSLDHQLPQLIELIAAGLDAERATLFLYDSETGELFSRIARGEGVAEIPDQVDHRHCRCCVRLGDDRDHQRYQSGPALQPRGGSTDRLPNPQHIVRAVAQSSRSDNRCGAGFGQTRGVLHPARRRLGYHTPTTFPKLNETIAAYEAGLERYLQRDWDSAIRYFGNALDAAPQDRPSRIFIDRCRYYRDNPPLDAWNGVWVMEQK